MVAVTEFEKDLKKLGEDYFINELKQVSDITVWAEENSRTLSEPHLPMKLIADNGDTLSMVIQSEISEEMLSDVIRNLAVRWSVKDNATDIEKKLDTAKKRLAFCFLKEYVRTLNKVEGGELSEDEWVLEEMEYLGYFEE